MFDLSEDPGERIDLSMQYPEKFEELLGHWKTYCSETGTQWGTKAKGDLSEPFGECPTDCVGGDPVEQCTAWMDVGEGKVAKETLPSYRDLPGVTDGVWPKQVPV